MKYTTLGTTGLRVSRLALGCSSFGGTNADGYEWSFGYEKAKPIIDRAVDKGINYFDTADVYSYGKSEEILGKALQGRRSDMVVATKVGLPTGAGPDERGLGRKHVRRSLKASLAHLKTDWIDLYQIHRWDYDTPPQTFLRTLNETVRGGAVRHIGASSTWAWQLEKALCISDDNGFARFETMQNHYNLAYREEEREMIPLCREERVAVLPWSPLARGFLSGKYK
ncbi:MAG TPA: aldo/keto reductase, partial [Nitrososphaerales archaeon]|nr:aldo/keto reductase [Nitrososphaerales archaeon]